TDYDLSAKPDAELAGAGAAVDRSADGSPGVRGGDFVGSQSDRRRGRHCCQMVHTRDGNVCRGLGVCVCRNSSTERSNKKSAENRAAKRIRPSTFRGTIPFSSVVFETVVGRYGIVQPLLGLGAAGGGFG